MSPDADTLTQASASLAVLPTLKRRGAVLAEPAAQISVLDALAFEEP